MQLEHEHSGEAIARRLAQPAANYLRDWLYGGLDGAVTTLAVVAGSAGGDIPRKVLLLLGCANVLADGFSMAAGNYLGTKAERDEYQRLRARERRHIELHPEGEREEVRQIFQGKGFSGEELERAVQVITADRDQWVNLMLTEEYGLARAQRAPLRAGSSTFAAFVLCGLAPLLPYFGGSQHPLWLATGATALLFFAIGAAKSRWSEQAWWRSALETLTIGLGAAGLAFLVGHELRQWLHLHAMTHMSPTMKPAGRHALRRSRASSS